MIVGTVNLKDGRRFWYEDGWHASDADLLEFLDHVYPTDEYSPSQGEPGYLQVIETIEAFGDAVESSSIIDEEVAFDGEGVY